MISVSEVFKIINTEITPVAGNLGFSIIIPEGTEKGAIPLFTRDSSSYIEYAGEKGKIRILFNDDKIRLLTGDKNASSTDDSDYTLTASYLTILDEYEARDIKSITNEITENITESFSPKQLAKKQQNIKAKAPVSRAAAWSGAVFYDPATLAIRLANLYPEIKDSYKAHLEKYDEFLCDDFFKTVVNPKVYATIRENNPVKIKKLFSILNEIYEDGTNEVQDVIVVTMLASFELDNEMHQRVLDNASDTMVEPFIRVSKILKTSKSSRMRLENPPKYKPKKQKKKNSMMSSLMGAQK